MLKIISGGQTGVDRAALDVALKLGLPCGGWCPLGRKAEDGMIAASYPLQETKSADYAVRTKKNVTTSDGTLIMTKGKPVGGTALTIDFANQLNKPLLVVDLHQSTDVPHLSPWIHQNSIKVMNVAGPRESQQPGFYSEAKTILEKLLQQYMQNI